MLNGRIFLAGVALDSGVGGDPWDMPCPSRAFAVELHRFGWMPGLLAQQEAGAREALRLTLDWLAIFNRWSPFSWGAERLERRTFRLACAVRKLIPLASDAEAQGVLDTLARQARTLLAERNDPARAAERAAVAAVVGAALAGKAGEALLASALPRLARALSVTVLPDGGVKTRNPEQALELLFDLLTLDDALVQRGRQSPAELSRAIDRLTGVVRFFTLADGRLAAFQGGEAVGALRIGAALAHDDADARVFGYAPQSGYHRLAGPTLQVMVDAAPPAQGAWSHSACAHPLSLEVVCGRDRLIGNPGWSADAQGPAAMRLVAGGSTVSLGDGSPGEPLRATLARALGPRLVGGAGRVDARRNETEAGVWLELAHDGWVQSLGLKHERRLYLDPKAEELRGEDRFEPVTGRGHSKRPLRLIPYAVRFHLPPEVQVSLARNKRSVLLRAASSRGWWLRNDAGEVDLEPSVWFERGLPKRALQIVLKGQANPNEPTRVRWKLAPVEPADDTITTAR